MSNLADQAETLAAATKSHLYPDPVLETLRDLAAENRRLSAEVERLQFVFEVKEEALRQAVAAVERLEREATAVSYVQRALNWWVRDGQPELAEPYLDNLLYAYQNAHKRVP